MSLIDDDRPRPITVMHATALEPEDELAQLHAVAIVAAAGGKLFSVHATDLVEANVEIPDALTVMRRWARNRGVSTEQLGSVEYQRAVRFGDGDAATLLLEAIAELEPELVVVGTRARHGVDLALMGSTAEALVRDANVPVLLLPAGHRGFVDPDTGELRLRRILVPMGDHHAAQAAMDGAVRLADLTGERKGDLILVHVGDEDDAPAVTLHGGKGWGRRWVQTKGRVVHEVIERAEAEQADLIVMASRGHDSLIDSILGSHTERVLRHSPCAVLAMPVTVLAKPVVA